MQPLSLVLILGECKRYKRHTKWEDWYSRGKFLHKSTGGDNQQAQVMEAIEVESIRIERIVATMKNAINVD